MRREKRNGWCRDCAVINDPLHLKKDNRAVCHPRRKEMRNGWCRECAPTKDPIAPEVSKGKLRLSLPVQPMRKYIEKRIGQLGQGEFARRIDVPERSLRRILDESETIQLSLADKILTMDGSHLMYVYPELYE